MQMRTRTSPTKRSQRTRETRSAFLRRLARTLSSTELHEIYAHRKEVAFVWSVEDVQEVRPDVSKELAWKVLEEVRHNHDCNNGVCWDSLSITADMLFGDAHDVNRGGDEE